MISPPPPGMDMKMNFKKVKKLMTEADTQGWVVEEQGRTDQTTWSSALSSSRRHVGLYSSRPTFPAGLPQRTWLCFFAGFVSPSGHFKQEKASLNKTICFSGARIIWLQPWKMEKLTYRSHGEKKEMFTFFLLRFILLSLYFEHKVK